MRVYWISFVQISLTKSELPVSQTGMFGFDSSNSTASFVKSQNRQFTPPPSRQHQGTSRVEASSNGNLREHWSAWNPQNINVLVIG
jgi:hypothetical protein